MRTETSVYSPFVVSITRNLISPATDDPVQLPFVQHEQALMRRNDYAIIRKGRRTGVILRGLKTANGVLAGGQIGVERGIQLHVDDGTVITDEQSNDWPWVRFFWAREGQLILVQSSFVYKFGLKINPFAKLLARIFEIALRGEFYVNVRCLPEEGEFWRVVDASDKMYFVEFDYVSPNIAGATAEHLKTVLDHFKYNMNSTDSVTRINNKDGDLNLRRDDVYLGAAISTIEKTGGRWKLKNERGVQNSREVVRKMDLPEVGALLGGDILAQVLDNIRQE